MKYQKFLKCLLAAAIIIGGPLLSHAALQHKATASQDELIGATPSNGDFPGIYNTTPTDLGLRDGYGSSLAVDQNGRVILSPSSTVGGGGSTPTLAQVTAAGASTSLATTFNGGLLFSSATGTGNLNIASVSSSAVTTSKQYIGQGGSASDVRLQLGNGSTGLYSPNTNQFYLTAGGLDKVLIDSSNGLQPIGNIIPDNPGNRSVGTPSSPFAVGTFITASTTNLTSAGRFDANNITVTGTLVAVGNISTQGQLSASAGGTAFFASGSGSMRAGDGTFSAVVADFNHGAKPSAGTDYETATDREFLRNGNQFLALTSGSAATSSMNTQYFQFGIRNTSTVMYIGTGDGCGRWTFAASNTSPTLTPVPVANCN